MLREIDRWRIILGKHIRALAGFSGQRACDRRLQSLLKAHLLKRNKIIYGVPSVYRLAYKAKMLIGANKRQDKIRLDNVAHDIAVLDTAIYFTKRFNIPLKDIVTEKQLHSNDGFSTRTHYPDFIFTKDKQRYCVEVELSLKSRDRLEKNIKTNFQKYKLQIWVINSDFSKVSRLLRGYGKQYTNIKIIDIKEIQKYVKYDNEYK